MSHWKVDDFITELQHLAELQSARPESALVESLRQSIKQRLSSVASWTAPQVLQLVNAAKALEPGALQEKVLQAIDGLGCQNSNMKLAAQSKSVACLSTYLTNEDWDGLQSAQLVKDGFKIDNPAQSLSNYPANPKDLGKQWLSQAYGESEPACREVPELAVLMKKVPLRRTSSLLAEAKPAKAGPSAGSSADHTFAAADMFCQLMHQLWRSTPSKIQGPQLPSRRTMAMNNMHCLEVQGRWHQCLFASCLWQRLPAVSLCLPHRGLRVRSCWSKASLRWTKDRSLPLESLERQHAANFQLAVAWMAKAWSSMKKKPTRPSTTGRSQEMAMA